MKDWVLVIGILLLMGLGASAEQSKAAIKNGELKILGPTLMKLTSTGVYHTGEIPAGCKALDPKLSIKVEGEPLVVGMFKHQDGSTWAMIVNRHLRNKTTARLIFKGKVQEMSLRSLTYSLI